MVSTTVLTNLLLSSAASLEALLQRRTADRQSNTTRYLETPANNVRGGSVRMGDWGGAIRNDGAGTWSIVSARFTVPNITLINTATSYAYAWVGIDGDSCESASFETGVECTITGTQVSYSAYYNWSGEFHRISGISFQAGDVVVLTTNASSPNSDIAKIENLTNHQQVTQAVTSPQPLCLQDASWLVKDNSLDTIFNLANFHTIMLLLATLSASTATPILPTS